MKRKLIIISSILALVMCLSLLTACAGISDDVLDQMVVSLRDDYQNGFGGSKITKESFTVPGRFYTEDEKGNEVIARLIWTSSNAAITVSEMDPDTEECTINIPATVEEAISYSLTVTIANEKGKAYEKGGVAYGYTIEGLSVPATDFATTVKAAFNDLIVTAPVAGTTYKLAAYRVHAQKIYYFKGTTSKSYVMETTENYDEAADFGVDVVDGGYHLYYMNGTTKTYLELLPYNTSDASIQATTETPASVVTFDAASKAPVSTLSNGATGYYCIRDKYEDEIRAYNIASGFADKKYETSETACYLISGKLNMPSRDTTGTTNADLFAQANALAEGQSLWGEYTLTGTIIAVVSGYSSSWYNGTWIMDVNGTEVKLNNLMGEGIVDDIEVGDTVTVTGAFGKYQYNATSSAPIGFLPTCQASNLVKGAGSEPVVGPTMVETFTEGTAYKLVMCSQKAGNLYVTGQIANSYYGATVTDAASAPNWYVEIVDGGYHLYFLNGETKTYLNAVVNGTKINVAFGTTASSVWTWDTTKKAFITTVGSETVNCGTYDSFDTLSMSKISYFDEDSYAAYLTLAE